MATIFGALRVKNEARWIERVIRSIQPLCERIFIFDDHSEDGTPDMCRRLDGVTVYRSAFSGLDEARDKNWLLARLYEAVPVWNQHYTRGNLSSPYWALAIDGDEELVRRDIDAIKEACDSAQRHVFSFRVLYLWDDPERVRIDGVYGRFHRPSLFRLMNSAFTYQKTPWGNGANFHCSQIPQEMLHHADLIKARLLHYGYLAAEDRIRKFLWYNRIDPDNPVEDFYRHMVQGDAPEIPATAKLKWAGPMQFAPLGTLL